MCDKWRATALHCLHCCNSVGPGLKFLNVDATRTCTCHVQFRARFCVLCAGNYNHKVNSYMYIHVHVHVCVAESTHVQCYESVIPRPIVSNCITVLAYY